jgi:hypothetical protein
MVETHQRTACRYRRRSQCLLEGYFSLPVLHRSIHSALSSTSAFFHFRNDSAWCAVGHFLEYRTWKETRDLRCCHLNMQYSICQSMRNQYTLSFKQRKITPQSRPLIIVDLPDLCQCDTVPTKLTSPRRRLPVCHQLHQSNPSGWCRKDCLNIWSLNSMILIQNAIIMQTKWSKVRISFAIVQMMTMSNIAIIWVYLEWVCWTSQVCATSYFLLERI